MRYLIGVLLFSASITSLPVQCKEQQFAYENPRFLQKSCQEVVTIFHRKDQPSTYAALHTSMAEAMRAGYCIGVIQQYMNQTPHCNSGIKRRGDWFEVATAIADLAYGEEQFKSIQVSQLLEMVYCG